ncbi:hypothetical protein VE00_10275 [Pseudogymnoascus sp. WSF 3629]|nr:hypothetical protein VE00_10275 [Pseudogymnoascus sp. WSF 3629]
MPTFVVTATAGRLSADKKAAIANALVTIHSAENGVPRWCVQVIFHEISAGNHFIGDKFAPADQLWIYADTRPGRTTEKKTAMIDRMVKEVSTAGGVDESYIWVYVNEISEMAKFGMHFPPPGMEAAFVASLPVEVRQRYE